MTRPSENSGGVDVSIQNAGVITIARIEAMTEADWDKVMAVNTKGVFLCCQEAIARMRKHNAAAADHTAPDRPGRASSNTPPLMRPSKFGVMGITQSLAKESRKKASPSTPSVLASSRPTCGLITTRFGASFSEPTSPEN